MNLSIPGKGWFSEAEGEEILYTFQLDQWVMPGGAPRATIASHADRDHDPFRTQHSKPVFIPFGFSSPYMRGDVRPVMAGYTREFRYRRLIFHITPIDYRVLGTVLGKPLKPLHCHWWLIRKEEVAALFIGDLNMEEVGVVEEFCERWLKRGLGLVLLPSYGGVPLGTHGITRDRFELRDAINGLAKRLKQVGLVLAALPHPTTPEWASYTFFKMGVNSL